MEQKAAWSLEKIIHEELRWLNNEVLGLGLSIRETGQVEDVAAISQLEKGERRGEEHKKSSFKFDLTLGIATSIY